MENIIKMKHIILIVLTLVLCSCFQNLDAYGNPGLFTPRPLFLSNLPKGNDDFSRGFRDGCHNFVGQTGYGINRMFDRAPDPQFLQTDDLYWSGYTNGDRYCSVYVNKDIVL